MFNRGEQDNKFLLLLVRTEFRNIESRRIDSVTVLAKKTKKKRRWWLRW